MAKQNWKTQLKARNLEELRDLKTQYPDLEVIEFSPLHLRLIGTRRVDFWPSSSRAWVVGPWRGSKVMTPAQAVALAFGEASLEQRQAREAHSTLDAEYRAILK